MVELWCVVERVSQIRSPRRRNKRMRKDNVLQIRKQKLSIAGTEVILGTRKRREDVPVSEAPLAPSTKTGL